MQIINFGNYLVPLAIAVRTADDKYELSRYGGCAFVLNSQGWLGTCAHIVKRLAKDEVLVAHDTDKNKMYPVVEIAVHANMDFAVGRSEVQKVSPMPFAGSVIPGLDVFAMGHTSAGKSGTTVNTERRYLKGYVT